MWENFPAAYVPFQPKPSAKLTPAVKEAARLYTKINAENATTIINAMFLGMRPNHLSVQRTSALPLFLVFYSMSVSILTAFARDIHFEIAIVKNCLPS